MLERGARSLRAPPAAPACAGAQTPALRARLSRPFRCSSQDRGRASRGDCPARSQSTFLPKDRGRKRGAGRRGPAPACAPGAGKDAIPADPNSPQAGWPQGETGAGGGRAAIGRISRIPLDFRGRTRPQTLGFEPFFITRRGLERRPPPTLSWCRARSPQLSSPEDSGAGGNSSCSPRRQTRSGGCESRRCGCSSPQSSPCPLQWRLPHPHPESAPRHLPWASSAERQSRAAPPRPDIPGAMAEAGAGGSERATVDDDLAPGWAWSHPTQGGRGARLSQMQLRGQRVQFGDTLRGGGVPGPDGYTLGAGGGAAPGGRSLHLPQLVPPAGSARRGGSRTCSPEPGGRGRPGGYLEPSAESPGPTAQLESELTRGCRLPTQAPISSVLVVTPRG